MLHVNLQSIRHAIRTKTYLAEAQSVEYMLSTNPLGEEDRQKVHAVLIRINKAYSTHFYRNIACRVMKAWC